MSHEVSLAVSMIIDRDTEVRCVVDDVSADATFTFIGTQGFESYLLMDSDALQRFHEMTGTALEQLRATTAEP